MNYSPDKLYSEIIREELLEEFKKDHARLEEDLYSELDKPEEEVKPFESALSLGGMSREGSIVDHLRDFTDSMHLTGEVVDYYEDAEEYHEDTTEDFFITEIEDINYEDDISGYGGTEDNDGFMYSSDDDIDDDDFEFEDEDEYDYDDYEDDYEDSEDDDDDSVWDDDDEDGFEFDDEYDDDFEFDDEDEDEDPDDFDEDDDFLFDDEDDYEDVLEDLEDDDLDGVSDDDFEFEDEDDYEDDLDEGYEDSFGDDDFDFEDEYEEDDYVDIDDEEEEDAFIFDEEEDDDIPAKSSPRNSKLTGGASSLGGETHNLSEQNKNLKGLNSSITSSLDSPYRGSDDFDNNALHKQPKKRDSDEVMADAILKGYDVFTRKAGKLFGSITKDLEED